MFNIAIFKERTKALCKKNGISQKFLSESTGHGQYYLNDVWLGKRDASDSDLQTISKVLHTTPEYLKGETDDPALADDYMSEIEKSPLKRDFVKRVAAMSDSDILAIANLLKQFKGE